MHRDATITSVPEQHRPSQLPGKNRNSQSLLPAKRGQEVVVRTSPIASTSQPAWVSSKYLRCLLDDPSAPLPSQPWDDSFGRAAAPVGQHRPIFQAAAALPMTGATRVTAPLAMMSTRIGASPARTHPNVPRPVCGASPRKAALTASADLLTAPCHSRPFDEATSGVTVKQPRETIRSLPASPESQHRECSQPTPQLDAPTPVLDGPGASLSLPTPQLVDDPTPCLSLPTPQLFQPAPLASEAKRYVSEPTPQLPE